MPRRRTPPAIVLAAAIALLAGCAAVAPPAPEPSPPALAPVPDVAAPPSAVQRAVERRRAAALKAEREGRLAAAATQWRIVLLLAPDEPAAAARLAEVRRAIERTVGEELAAAHEAMRRGDAEVAQQSLLNVLSIEPAHEEATAMLREIDRHRAMKRAAERAALARAEPPPTLVRGRAPPARRAAEGGDDDVEQSLELLRSGGARVALAELRRHVAAHPRDRAVRERIATAVREQARVLQAQGAEDAAVDMYDEAIRLHGAAPREWARQLAQLKARLAGEEYEKGLRLVARDVAAAITHFETSLRYAPSHTQAQLQLERARRMQQSLRAIEAGRKPN